ncbi:MAG TPA: GNAT family N-acetyltransferase [Alkalispirochaeta sp.]|nr:GNAT family N-acetyltransferase [Alkalispirochaeta sp.]
MDIRITSLASCWTKNRDSYLAGAEAVFWETANTAEFASPVEEHAFQWRYFGYYAAHAPQFFLVAHAPNPPLQVLGYICGVADTRSHRELYHVAAHVPVFDDLYEAYPAHLHINLTAESRGMGLGGRLVAELSAAVAAHGAPGIHLVTSAGARNVSFYRRNGFVEEVQRPLASGGGQAEPLLFLGKRLEPHRTDHVAP